MTYSEFIVLLNDNCTNNRITLNGNDYIIYTNNGYYQISDKDGHIISLVVGSVNSENTIKSEHFGFKERVNKLLNDMQFLVREKKINDFLC